MQECCFFFPKLSKTDSLFYSFTLLLFLPDLHCESRLYCIFCSQTGLQCQFPAMFMLWNLLSPVLTLPVGVAIYADFSELKLL